MLLTAFRAQDGVENRIIVLSTYRVCICREILDTAKNIRALRSGAKYGVDYYQREYRWQTKHVAELLDDLAEKFLGSYEPAHERSAVEGWANHPERHKDEFTHQADFREYRNRLGGLLLLSKAFNASYGDLPYAEKREHYLKQNLLAQSLHELAHERSPGFLRFAKASMLPFHAHAEFKTADLDARQQLYRRIAENLWSPTRLHEELASKADAA